MAKKKHPEPVAAATPAPTREACVGCGHVVIGEHPIVGIGRLDLDNNGVDDPMTAHPVCEQCWIDPAHRTLRTLKVTFFPRSAAPGALAAAHATDRLSKIPGATIGVAFTH